MAEGAGLVVNLAEIARLLGASVPSARKLAGQPGFPVPNEGRNGEAWQLDDAAVAAGRRNLRVALERAREARRDTALSEKRRDGSIAHRQETGRYRVPLVPARRMAHPTGFEPVTSGFGGPRIIARLRAFSKKWMVSETR